jgi:hypothetical protein
LKRNSSKTSREIRKFWLKIDKVVAFRQKGEADDVRQKVYNVLLNSIILTVIMMSSILI